MEFNQIRQLWHNSIAELLGAQFSKEIVDCLAYQTIDSIRRIVIFETYKERARTAEHQGLSYFHTSNPFTLAQRDSLSKETRVWHIYVATYFGKSNASKWDLFNRATFKKDKSLISYEWIIENDDAYFNYLKSFDFFKNGNFSNHRKYTKKSLAGDKGFLNSFKYFIEKLELFNTNDITPFDKVYRDALLIPNFGRMAAFDFTCNLCKCGFQIDEPESMYQKYSTGPLSALRDILILSEVQVPSKSLQISIGDELLNWFKTNSDIFMIAQVLEDAICNWQKSPKSHKRFFG